MLSPQLTGSFFTNLKEFLQRYDCFRFEEFPEVLITVRQGQSHTHKYRKRNRVRAQERGVEGLDWGGAPQDRLWHIPGHWLWYSLSLSLLLSFSPPTLPVLPSPSFLWWVEQFFPNKSSLISDPSALALISCLMSLPSVCCGLYACSLQRHIHTCGNTHMWKHTHALMNSVCVSECSIAKHYKQSPHALVQSARLWVSSSS